jgi:phosphoglycolate phosphatase-like HAD superfamily hydrolase
MRLLLFDIDGTLIRSNQAGRMALGAALEELFGTTGPLETYRMGGKTDSRIVKELMTAAGISPRDIEAKLPDVFTRMADHAQRIYPERGIEACLGVDVLLAELQKREDVLVGLLTGNSYSTSPLKLRAAGIDLALFKVGAYGSDDFDRNRLPALAIQRAVELTGMPFTGADAVIIGDTPADVLCARAGKATAVSVASGWHSAETLAQYHPDYLFEDLSDTAAVLSALLGNEVRG